MSKLYIQNKSDKEFFQLLNLDNVGVLATLAPGQYVELKSNEGKMVTPFIVREVKNTEIS